MVQRRRRSKKWISWLIILILLIAAVVVAYQVWDNYFNDKKEPETSEIKDEENKKDETEIKTDIPEAEPEEKKENVQYDGENPNNNADLTGVITYAAVSGNDLVVRLNIDQYLSGGSCKIRLVVEDDLEVYSEVVNIVNSASTATCEGFNIPLSKIGSGNYKIYVNLESGDKFGTINGEVNI